MKNFLLEQQQKSEKIAILREFIHSNSEARELKRADRVQMALENTPYSKITTLLGISKSFITHWKRKFESVGLDGIKLGYQGAKSYLKLKSFWLQSMLSMNQTNGQLLVFDLHPMHLNKIP